MSIEYRAAAKLAAAKVAGFLDAVASHKQWAVAGRQQRVLLLRWASPERKGAGEDARIEVEPEGVYLAVHVGTRQQRELLVREVHEALHAQGATANLEEL